jgi:chaperonin GroES
MKTKSERIRPLHDFVLAEPVAEQKRSPGGIYIPDVAKDKPQRGTILAVGTGNIRLKTGN